MSSASELRRISRRYSDINRGYTCVTIIFTQITTRFRVLASIESTDWFFEPMLSPTWFPPCCFVMPRSDSVVCSCVPWHLCHAHLIPSVKLLPVLQDVVPLGARALGCVTHSRDCRGRHRARRRPSVHKAVALDKASKCADFRDRQSYQRHRDRRAAHGTLGRSAASLGVSCRVRYPREPARSMCSDRSPEEESVGHGCLVSISLVSRVLYSTVAPYNRPHVHLPSPLSTHSRESWCAMPSSRARQVTNSL